MRIGSYVFHVDALLARIVYRWRWQSVTFALLLIAIAALATGLVPPFWRGQATLMVNAAPGATVQVDGRDWPRTIYAGWHTIRASLPDSRGAWADVDLHAGQPFTLTLPAGLPDPQPRALPSSAPGTHIDQVWWADGAWRVVSVPDTPALQDGRPTVGPSPTALPGQIVAVSPQSVERLSTLDAYAGLADQVHVQGQLIEAVYRANTSRGFGDQSTGAIEVRGWAGTPTLPISAPLTLLRFAPSGQALLAADQAPGGQQVYLISRAHGSTPLVAVPGQIARLSWRPDSRAVVIHSVQGERLTLTLVRLAPSIAAAVIADLPADRSPGGIAPLAWNDAGLLWTAPDQSGASALWQAPLTTLIPERMGALAARALTCLPDGTLRVVTIQGAYVAIGRYRNDLFVGETIVPRVPPAADLVGIWQGSELLLQGAGQAWLLDVVEEDK